MRPIKVFKVTCNIVLCLKLSHVVWAAQRIRFLLRSGQREDVTCDALVGEGVDARAVDLDGTAGEIVDTIIVVLLLEAGRYP
jgi:hypothetical protein